MTIRRPILRPIRSSLGPVALAAVLSALGGTAGAQAVQLRTGEVLVGEVTDATGDGLTFRRLDNGGLLQLRWEDLSAACATSVKRLKGLVVENEVEVTIEADVIVFAPPGGGREEVVGIAEWTDTHVLVKRKGGDLKILRDWLKDKPRKRAVPVLEVYTPSGYYEQQLAEIAPGKDADKHIQLAEAMRRAALYDLAVKHLEQAQELGGGRQKSLLPAMLARARMLVESAEERELLSQIRQQRNRGEFKRAQELIEQFQQQFPDTRLGPELAREKQRHQQERERALIETLRQKWDSTVDSVANDKTGERDLTLEAVRTYAEDQMAKDVFARLARVLGEDPEEIARLWQNRMKFRKGGRGDIYTYGIGSWVLPEDKIIEGTKVAETGDDKSTAGSEDSQELDRLIRKLRENQKRGRRAAAKRPGEAEETEEEWWRTQSRGLRTAWLRTYFAEYGGQMEVTAAYATPCLNCAGKGFTIELGSSGKEVHPKCTVCHGTKHMRAVRAR